jgi:hypothetical protein
MEKLPIPRIDQAVRWVAVKISAVLGDSYMLAHCGSARDTGTTLLPRSQTLRGNGAADLREPDTEEGIRCR